MKFRTTLTALTLAAIVPIGACSKVDEERAVTDEQAVNRTLAAAISEARGLTKVSSALSDAGLAGVFDGPGSYTVLAPDDDVFGQLGKDGKALTSDEEKPILIAVLRDHILPGHLTPEAIRKAITDQGGAVEVRTLGEGTVSFSLDGEDIAIAGDDGLTAKVNGAALAASNGVVIPIDGLLKKPQPIAQ